MARWHMDKNNRMIGRPQVYTSHRFTVEIDGLEEAGFSEVSGLTIETELEEVREGGVNHFVHKFVKQTKPQPIVLKHGITLSPQMYEWYQWVIEGHIIRLTGAIIMYDDQDEILRRWNFFDAFPYKWVGPELNASRSEVAFESIELAHNGFKETSRGG
ncbi:phage tail protein [Paenibacillus sp. TRM 82003]|nr:phage tail protein [Paenibacillus sp. TRM 82003]